MISKIITSITLALSSAATIWASPNVLQLSHEITDTAIVFPESAETDVHRMMQDWYLQNYTVMATNPDNVSTDIPATDQQIIQRLAAIPTTIEMPFNQIVRAHIELYTQRRRALVETMLGMSLFYLPIFEDALEAEGLPMELRYLPVIESAMNPNAVSRAGATGLWQFMLPTARGLGLEINTLVDERRDPVASSHAAARFLKQLYNIYGDWSLAIAAYNCGPGNVNKARRRVMPSAPADSLAKLDFWSIYYNLPAETRGYVPAFIAANYVMNYYSQHGISPALARRPIITDTIHVKRRIHFNQIASVLNIPVEEIRTLNPQYRKDIIPGDVRPYSLRLPSKLVYAYILSEDSIAAYNASQYARRGVVEPSHGVYGSSTRQVTRIHKVKRNETLAAIAKRYGVTQSDIKKWNKLKSTRLRRGQSLKIYVYEAVPQPKPTPKTTSTATTAPEQPAIDTVMLSDSTGAVILIDSASTDSNVTPAPAVKPAQPSKTSTKPAQSTKPKTPTTVTHTVRRGESPWKIANRYGITVAELQKANGLTNKSKIQPGQKLKIPKK